KAEHRQPLLFDPGLSRGGVCKLRRRHGRSWPITQLRKRLNSTQHVGRRELNDQIEVAGRTEMTMEDNRNTPSDEVSNLGGVQRREHRLDGSHHAEPPPFHVASHIAYDTSTSSISQAGTGPKISPSKITKS